MRVIFEPATKGGLGMRVGRPNGERPQEGGAPPGGRPAQKTPRKRDRANTAKSRAASEIGKLLAGSVARGESRSPREREQSVESRVSKLRENNP